MIFIEKWDIINNQIDISKVTACGECCDNCKHKEEFSCADLEKKIHWRKNVVDELRTLAENFK